MKISWPGFNEKSCLLIELLPESFCLAKENINVFGEHFTPKDELHVTLIGSKTGSIILGRVKQDQTINQLLENMFGDIDWSFKQTGPVHILSRSKGSVVEKSIIMLLEMHGVTAFYEQLRSHGLIDSNTPVPPPHVTLYTHNCPLGIGVPDNKSLKALSIKTLSVKTLDEIFACICG